MKVIYKYKISAMHCKISMPEKAQILHVDEQGGEICLWALVDTENPIEQREFVSVYTGDELPAEIRNGLKRRHVNTVFLHSKKLVVHIFEYFRNH